MNSLILLSAEMGIIPMLLYFLLSLTLFLLCLAIIMLYVCVYIIIPLPYYNHPITVLHRLSKEAIIFISRSLFITYYVYLLKMLFLQIYIKFYFSNDDGNLINYKT